MIDASEDLLRRNESAASNKTAVVLDQHPLWLEAVEPVVAGIGVEVVGKTTSPAEALALVEAHRPDLVVVETRTADPELPGLTFIREVRARVPALKIVVLAMSADPEDVAAAFEAGATAYVVKTAHADDIATTVRQAFEHSVFFNGGGAVALRPAGAADGNGHSNGDDAGLTRREREILSLVAEGRSNSQLARMLWVTEQTVKFHLSNIYRKLDVSNRTEASAWAHRHQLVSLEAEAS
jgi:DNA-binding NarL/FixJ family response regulator